MINIKEIGGLIENDNEDENTVGDTLRVDLKNDRVGKSAVFLEEGKDRIEVEIYRNKQGEFQAVVDFEGKKYIGTSKTDSAHAVSRLVHTLHENLEGGVDETD